MPNSYISSRLFWFFLFTYVVLGMHFFMHNQGGSGLYLPFNMVGWIFLSILIALGFWHLTATKQLVLSESYRWFLSGFAILFLPFLNPNAEWNFLAEPRFLAIASGFLLYFSLSQLQFIERHRHGLLYLLLVAVAIEITLGLVQFFLLKDDNWLGYNTKINRPYGIFQKDSVFSSFIATGLALSFYLQRWDPGFLTSRWKQGLSKFILLSVPLLLVQIQSRAGIYGAVLIVSCLLPLFWYYNRRIFWSSLLLVALSFIIGVMIFNAARSAESYEVTTSFRKLYWAHLLSMVPQSPWLGHGYGSFEYTFLHDFYAPENIKPGMRLMEENLDHPHNELLFWLYEGGIVAVIGLLVIAAGYIKTLLKCSGWAKRISLLALVLPLLFHSMVEYPFYHSVAHFFFFVVFLWLADAESGQQKIIECKYWFLARMLAILIPLLVVPFMLTGLQAASILTKYDRMKDKNPQMLDQIINPLPWMMLYEFQMRSAQLTFSAAMHDKTGLESFVSWAKGFLHDTPRSVVYAQLVFALQQLNDIEQAQQWLAEGKRLFPKAVFLQKNQLVLSPSTSAAK
jgi:O-antigen polymerase